MKFKAIKIPLIRKKQQFWACAALVKGTLNEGDMHLGKLHLNERTIYEGYQYERRKASYLLGRLVAKHAILPLSSISNPRLVWIDTGVFQFPIVRGANLQNIQVSISHCDSIGFSVAYPEAHPMGIDIEKISEDRTATVLSQLVNNEKELLKTNRNDTISCYTAIFSIKEALSKILKTGMMLDFKFLEIKSFQLKEQVIKCTFIHFGQYKAFAYLQNGYVFAIVLPKRTSVQLDPVWRMVDGLNI